MGSASVTSTLVVAVEFAKIEWAALMAPSRVDMAFGALARSTSQDLLQEITAVYACGIVREKVAVSTNSIQALLLVRAALS